MNPPVQDSTSIKLMVASSIHGFEDQLEQICSTFQAYGYDVWNSHFKTIPVHPGKSNTDNCLIAVERCDAFFGIIRPSYGSVVIGNKSITHLEMLKAIKLNKPRWFVAHRDINIARQLLKQYMYDEDKQPITDFQFKGIKGLFDDIRLIDLYNSTIRNDLPPDQRIGHWIDEYFKIGDILKCAATQFSDIDRVRSIIDQMKNDAGK